MEYIDLYDKIQSLDLSNQQLRIVCFPRRIPLLTSLYLQNNSFGEVFDCAQQLKDCPNLKLLNLSYNTRIQQVLNLPRSLTHLYVDGMDCEVGHSPTLEFISFVQQNCTIDAQALRQNFPQVRTFLVHQSAVIRNTSEDYEVQLTRVGETVSARIKLDPEKEQRRRVVYDYVWMRVQDALK